MEKLLIKNAIKIYCFDDRNTTIDNGDIYIENQAIKDIGKNLTDKYRHLNPTEIDASGCIVLPGFINTHHHLYQTLTRCIPEVQNSELFDWLRYLYLVWRKITPEVVYISTIIGCAELIMTGCTTTSDMFYIFPNNKPKDLIDYEIEAAKQIGIRFYPSRGAMSRGQSRSGLPPDELVQTESEIINDYERLVKEYHDPKEFSMCRIALAPCSPFSITDELMKITLELAKKYNLLCHTHISETLEEVSYCYQKYNKRPIEYLNDLDWLGENIWLAHCIHLNENELQMLIETKTGISHCPTSNMKLGSGIAPIKELMNDTKVSLAVDGSASNDSCDMLSELKHCFLLHRLRGKDKWLSVEDVFYLATKSGAKVLNRNDTGSIEIGKAADISIFDLSGPEYIGALTDPLTALLVCGHNHKAKFVIINGKIVVKDFNLETVDLERIKRDAKDYIRGL